MSLKFINPDTKEKIVIEKGFHNLLPKELTCEQEHAENKMHINQKMNKTELFFELFNKKKGYISYFLKSDMPLIKKILTQKGKNFVEIAGGLCYISTIVKNMYPETEVCATDIAPDYLKNKSIPLADNFFSHSPDYFIAASASNLPFDDNCADIIYCSMAMHHFYSVENFLSEIKRILKPSGVFIGIDTAEPLLNNKPKKAKQVRAKEENIFENPHTYFDWKKFCKNTGGFKVNYIRSFNTRLFPNILMNFFNLYSPFYIFITNTNTNFKLRR